MNLLNDPEYGGPRSPEEIAAARKADAGSSQVMEKAISEFMNNF